jgi:hypothetical protein
VNCAAARDEYRTSLELAVRLGDRTETALEMQGVSMAMAGLGRWTEGLHLGGAAEAELERLGVDISGVRFWSELLERCHGPARSALGEPAFDSTWSTGRAMGFERATELALDTA